MKKHFSVEWNLGAPVLQGCWHIPQSKVYKLYTKFTADATLSGFLKVSNINECVFEGERVMDVANTKTIARL